MTNRKFWSKAMAVGDEEWLKSQATLLEAKSLRLLFAKNFIILWEDSMKSLNLIFLAD